MKPVLLMTIYQTFVDSKIIKKRLHKRVFIPFFLSIVIIVLLFFYCSPQSIKKQTSLRIAMPYSIRIQDTDTNYYKLWLEEKTGIQIEIDFIPQGYTEEYMRLLFTTGNSSDVDVVFFDSSTDFPSAQLINEYGKNRAILPLEDYITHGVHLQEIFDHYEDYDLRTVMEAADGSLYYMPALDTSIVNRKAQTLWLNVSWLKALKLSMPQTTEDLVAVLQAFRDNDPNGNGITDEIPLIGSNDEPALLPINFLMNSFVYNDWENSRMAMQDGSVFFAPQTEQWRQGLICCRTLYQEGLLPGSFDFSAEQLVRLVNDPRDLVGGFTASGIDDVIFQGSPELTSRFVQILPLLGPENERSAVVRTSLPSPGGVITASCKNPEAAFLLMDTMLSEEASLIGRYGEQTEDWDFAGPGSISPSGKLATIVVQNFMRNKLQNKTLLEIGPFVTRSKYVDGLAWRGFQADHEYVNARAADSYRPYEPREYIKTILFNNENAELELIRTQLDKYTEEAMEAFITGRLDPESDAAWADYLVGYDALEINRLIELTSQSQLALIKK